MIIVMLNFYLSKTRDKFFFFFYSYYKFSMCEDNIKKNYLEKINKNMYPWFWIS